MGKRETLVEDRLLSKVRRFPRRRCNGEAGLPGTDGFFVFVGDCWKGNELRELGRREGCLGLGVAKSSSIPERSGNLRS